MKRSDSMILQFEFIMASVMRIALKLSKELWTLKIEAPNSRQ